MQWTIQQMDCYPEQGADTDVVFRVHWTLSDTRDGYTGSVYGTAALTLDPNAPFIPYDQLTEEQVVLWVQEALPAEQKATAADAINRQIEAQKNPPIVTPPLPW